MSEQLTRAMTLLRRKQVEAETGLSRSTIYDRMKAGTFPKFVRISSHSVAWRRGDIDAWLKDPFGYRASMTEAA